MELKGLESKKIFYLDLSVGPQEGFLVHHDRSHCQCLAPVCGHILPYHWIPCELVAECSSLLCLHLTHTNLIREAQFIKDTYFVLKANKNPYQHMSKRNNEIEGSICITIVTSYVNITHLLLVTCI